MRSVFVRPLYVGAPFIVVSLLRWTVIVTVDVSFSGFATVPP
jgi:hypothetical protein